MSALALQLSQAVQDRSRCYRLPGDMERDDYIVPISGGADSTVVAIILKLLFPSVPFRYVMTDTLAEDPEIYAALARLEAATLLHLLLDRVTSIELAGEPVASPSTVITGLRSAPLVLR